MKWNSSGNFSRQAKGGFMEPISHLYIARVSQKRGVRSKPKNPPWIRHCIKCHSHFIPLQAIFLDETLQWSLVTKNCVSVNYSSASLRHVCDKLNLPTKSSLNSKGLQLADFAKKLSFLSYSLFFVFPWPSQPFAFIEIGASLSNDLYL